MKFIKLVGERRLELPQVTLLASKTSASTISPLARLMMVARTGEIAKELDSISSLSVPEFLSYL
jgi:hypothetical protein